MNKEIKKICLIITVIISLGFFTITVNAAEQNKVYTANHIKDEEARKIYQRVLNAVEYVLNEDLIHHSDCVIYYDDLGKNVIREGFITTVNISEDEFNSISPYELFLEFITYSGIQFQYIRANNPSMVFENEGKLKRMLFENSGVPGFLIDAYNDGTNKEPMEALIELYRYQYKYLQEHGCFYDFFRGADYLELQGMVQKKDEISKEEPSVETKQEVQEKEDIEIQEVKSEVSEEKPEKESNPLAPKNVFSDLIKNHIVSIIIISILVVLLAYITIKNKRTNKKDID